MIHGPNGGVSKQSQYNRENTTLGFCAKKYQGEGSGITRCNSSHLNSAKKETNEQNKANVARPANQSHKMINSKFIDITIGICSTNRGNIINVSGANEQDRSKKRTIKKSFQNRYN